MKRMLAAALLILAMLCATACAEKPDAGTMLPVEPTFTIRVVDQEGAPVPGAFVNICTETMCQPTPTDGEGTIAFMGEAGVRYHLTILKVPEGYDFDSAFERYVEPEETEVVVEVTKE